MRAPGDVFFTCRDGGGGMGVVNIFHEDSPDKDTKVADVKYMRRPYGRARSEDAPHVFDWRDKERSGAADGAERESTSAAPT